MSFAGAGVLIDKKFLGYKKNPFLLPLDIPYYSAQALAGSLTLSHSVYAAHP